MLYGNIRFSPFLCEHAYVGMDKCQLNDILLGAVLVSISIPRALVHVGGQLLVDGDWR